MRVQVTDPKGQICAFCARSFILLARLVRRQVPRVDNPALGGIDLPLVLDVLDANLQAVLGPDDVLLTHAL